MRAPSLSHRRRPLRARVASTLVALVALSGCFERSLGSLAPCTRAEVGDDVDLTVVEDVDLLFVVDDSGSMAEEQSELIRQIPRLVEVLASGDRGLDGTIDFRAARSIHVGIVSTDMGVAAATDVTTCDAMGDDGLLHVAGSRCTGAHGPVFDFERGGDAAAFAADVGCAADLGTTGCGEEQPLEAILKALSPSTPEVWTIPGYTAPSFLVGDGHGGRADANAGLVRDDSVLAIILISDENDSSTLDAELFSQVTQPYASTNINLRGLVHSEVLTPIQRYVEGLLALRGVPRHLVFGAIVGIPPEAASLGYDDMLRLPEMQERVDPSHADRLVAACRGPLQTDGAYPGRRAIELARGLAAAGAGASVSSICASSFEPALDGVIDLISEAFRGTCLPRALAVGADGRVTCEVREALAPIGTAPDERTHCAALGSSTTYELAGTETVVSNGETLTREVCRIHQLTREQVLAAGAGWFYEEGAEGSEVWRECPPTEAARTAQRISVQGIELVNGAQLRLVCDEAIQGRGGEVSLGTFCNPGATTDVCASALAPDHHTPLACDLFTRSCVVPCTSDAACTTAGLPGYACDDRAAAEYFGAALPSGLDETAIHDACVNATCR